MHNKELWYYDCPTTRQLAERDVRRGLNFTMILSLASVAAFWLIPIIPKRPEGHSVLLYITALLIWGLNILKLWFVFKTSNARRRLEKLIKVKRVSQKMPIGLISFLKNKAGTAADILLFASLITVVIFIKIGYFNPVISGICMSIMFLSFDAHCIFNGKNYRYIKTYSLLKKEYEKNE